MIKHTLYINMTFKHISCILVVCTLVYGAFANTCQTQFAVKDRVVTFNPLNGNLNKSTLETEYDAKGLQPFFDLANSFMNTVQPKSISKELKGVKIDDLTGDESFKIIRKYETPIIVAVAFGLLFMLLMPLVGICFCCCRCCGKCGGKKFQEPDEANKHSKCFIMSILLVVVAIFMLCGVLFMFVTNNRTHETANNLGDKYENVIDNVVGIATSSMDTVKTLSRDFAPCLIDLIKNEVSVNGTRLHIGEPLKTFVEVEVSGTLDNATKMADSVDNIKLKLDEIKTESEKLKALGTKLKTEINGVKDNLTVAYTGCGASAACQPINDAKSSIDVTIDFDDLPDIQSTINEIQDIKDKDLHALIATAKKTIEDIPATATTKSKSSIDDILNMLNNITAQLDTQVGKVVDDVNKQIDDKKPKLMKYKTDYLDTNADYFKYEDYRWYAYHGLAGVMAFILLLIALGLVLGICGYNKERLPSNRTSAANCGGNCLMAAVGFMFIFSFFLMLFCVIWYAVGIHLYLGCRDLKDGKLFDNVMGDSAKVGDHVVSVENLLNSCRNNDALYKAVGGEAVFNISEKFDFSNYTNVDKLIEGIKFDLNDQSVMTLDTKKALTDLTTSGVSGIDYAKFFETLEKKLTQASLTEVADNLTTIAKALTDPTKTSLEQIAKDLKEIDKTTVTNIKTNVTAFKPIVSETQNMANTMTTEASRLLSDMEAAETFIKSKTGPKVIQLSVNLSLLIIGYLGQATGFLVSQASSNLLRCKPVADLYDGLVNTLICDDVVQNANGFWLALGWCLLFFVVAIILCVRLAKYYRRMDYDAGVDNFEHPPYNDKIPLQTVRSSEEGSHLRFDTTESEQADHLPFTEYNILPQHDDLLPDYDMHAPPPYQQHRNQGYNNQ